MLNAGTRAPVTIRWLFWFRARSWTQPNTFFESGLWTGGISRSFTISGATRTYHGAGNIIGFDRLDYGMGASNVQSQTLELNGLTPEVEELLRGYNPSQAEVEIHRWRHPSHLEWNGNIERAFKGWVDTLDFRRSETDLSVGSVGVTCTVTMMSAARMGTRTLQLKKSDASQRLTNAADGGRKYNSSRAKVAWMSATEGAHRARNDYDQIR